MDAIIIIGIVISSAVLIVMAVLFYIIGKRIAKDNQWWEEKEKRMSNEDEQLEIPNIVIDDLHLPGKEYYTPPSDPFCMDCPNQCRKTWLLPGSVQCLKRRNKKR